MFYYDGYELDQSSPRAMVYDELQLDSNLLGLGAGGGKRASAIQNKGKRGSLLSMLPAGV